MMGLGSEALAFVREFIIREQLPDSYVNTGCARRTVFSFDGADG
jgi:hypothetical protein